MGDKDHTMTSMDIVDTAVTAGSFETLAAALGEAGLVGAPKGEGPFTVFAPTDEAFAKLPDGTVAWLLMPSNKQKLTDILTFDVIAGNVKAADMVKLSSAETLNGKSITIKTKDGMVFIDHYPFTEADIKATNGIIDVIDSVLIPE